MIMTSTKAPSFNENPFINFFTSLGVQPPYSENYQRTVQPKTTKRKKILYVDMDGVVADFEKTIRELVPYLDNIPFNEREVVIDNICNANPNVFLELAPMPGAIRNVKLLMLMYDVYFLSTPMQACPESFTDKRLWLDKHFGVLAAKRLILTHRKDLNIGDYLIDDRTKNGAGEFTGELILFGSDEFPNWNEVTDYLISNYFKQ